MIKTIIYYKDFNFTGFKPLFKKGIENTFSDLRIPIEFYEDHLAFFTIQGDEDIRDKALVKIGEYIGMFQAFRNSGYQWMKKLTIK